MSTAKPRSPLVADFEIVVNGSPLPVGVSLHVVGVEVDDSVELPSMFAVRLAASEHADQIGDWIDDQKLFAIGQGVEVRLGYSDGLASLLRGEITAVEVDFQRDRLPLLTLRGYDRRHRMLRGRKVRSFVQQKDSDIAAQIAADAGLTAQAEDSGVVHDYVLQANQSDLEFLVQRARLIQYEVGVDDRTLNFRPVANAGGEVLTLTLGDELLEFHPRLSSAGQISEVEVRGWSVKDKAAIVGKAASGAEVSTMGGQQSGAALAEGAFGAAVGMLSDHPVASQAEADQIARARFNRNVLELIEGEGACWGRTDLRAGQVIRIDGLGHKFSGAYYVVSANHGYTPQDGYRTRFVVRRNGS
ncbi:phage late control D family protein [Accumulibacter sp.]|uniref:phage late control D family protein n=1 Tax=Accumulibacter sp. TaxID=2053492 RepID=UPI0025F760F4|nr:contractile injection system protein, VgrG/Pvc8 family [Accumulibacter sp.]MCM8596516.1 contractile injection system protein, VgrG/Pvc8 family [Accumulibacter sp.]MCM8627312.1 contractile injection system protein, VgrG/Pvc8 family [Accumulibacter sp.]MDS4050665.1 contractile injection system protein, VgrG/Pvc8 family [Accumulibacter sp.]